MGRPNAPAKKSARLQIALAPFLRSRKYSAAAMHTASTAAPQYMRRAVTGPSDRVTPPSWRSSQQPAEAKLPTTAPVPSAACAIFIRRCSSYQNNTATPERRRGSQNKKADFVVLQNLPLYGTRAGLTRKGFPPLYSGPVRRRSLRRLCVQDAIRHVTFRGAGQNHDGDLASG